MWEVIKNLKNSIFKKSGIVAIQSNINNNKILNEWKSKNCPAPPPHIVKQMTIQQYQIQFKYKVFVETGTFLGDMVEAQRRYFEKVYSIELGTRLYENAKKRFERNRNVVIALGDSGNVLPKILTKINEPAIFWLDGHYSEGITAKGEKECPIFEELDAIFNAPRYNHVLLIDDARCFIGKGDYPNIETLTQYILKKESRYHIEVYNDIIRCTMGHAIQPKII
jgi:hypothetical protein